MSFQPWENPDPQSIFGLNSAMVYGENIQFAAGLNNQIALGSNTQLCVNPFALFDLLDLPGTAVLSGLWGSGLGGNMQFTIGTSTAVTWGRQFNITMGPEAISVTCDKNDPPTVALCCLIGAVVLAYAIGFGICNDEDSRAAIVIGFQIAMNGLLALFMMVQMAAKEVDKTLSETLKALWTVPKLHKTSVGEVFADAFAIVAILGALVGAPVVIAIEEGHFQGDTQS